MVKKIQELLQTVFIEKDNWKIRLLKNWPEVLGHMNTKVHLEKIEDDCLVLGVSDSCWMQELYMLSPLLLETVNKKLDAPRIKSLRFKKVGIRKQPKKQTFERGPDPFEIKALTTKEEQALARIKDHELRIFITKFLRRCQRES